MQNSLRSLILISNPEVSPKTIEAIQYQLHDFIRNIRSIPPDDNQ